MGSSRALVLPPPWAQGGEKEQGCWSTLVLTWGPEGLPSQEVTSRGLETLSLGRWPVSSRALPWAAGHADFSPRLPPPSAGPLGPGRKRARLDSPNRLVPTDSRAAVEGDLQGGGSLQPEGAGNMPGQLWGPLLTLPVAPCPQATKWGE